MPETSCWVHEKWVYFYSSIDLTVEKLPAVPPVQDYRVAAAVQFFNNIDSNCRVFLFFFSAKTIWSVYLMMPQVEGFLHEEWFFFGLIFNPWHLDRTSASTALWPTLRSSEECKDRHCWEIFISAAASAPSKSGSPGRDFIDLGPGVLLNKVPAQTWRLFLSDVAEIMSLSSVYAS